MSKAEGKPKSGPTDPKDPDYGSKSNGGGK